MANSEKTKWHKKAEKWLKSWHMGIHQRELSESYPIKTRDMH